MLTKNQMSWNVSEKTIANVIKIDLKAKKSLIN